MKHLGTVLAGLALLTLSAAARTNGTFAYAVKDGKLVPINKPPSSEVRKYHDPPFGNTPVRAPHNGPGECLSDWEYDYTMDTTAGFWGIDNNRRNVYEKASKTVVCSDGTCDLIATETLTKTVSWKIAGDVNFDVKAVKVKIGGDYGAQTTTTRTTSYKLQISAGKSGYIGFGASWVQVDGNKRSTPVTCCRFGRCTRGNPKNSHYTAYYPRSLSDGVESDGIYNICTGAYDNQKCSPTGVEENISKCKGKGTLISGQTLQGCTDNYCTDPSRILVSTNNANRVAIHTSGDMCVYGTRNGQYSNTWCSGASMDPSKGPFYGTLESDGNFCLYTRTGSNYWCSRKTSTDNGQYRAIIQNDGNFVIYTADNNPIWNSGTAFGSIPFPYCGKGGGGGGGGGSNCSGGNPGKGDGDGGEGACCKTEADCKDCCTAGVCNGACSAKRSLASYASY